MPVISAQVTTEFELSIETAAAWFCELDDDQQAKFFVAVAERAKSWPHGGDSQWHFIGGHLRNCECSTEAAREMIRGLAYALEHSNHV